MPIHNADIASIFNEIADLIEIEEANPFRVRAYRNASRTLQGMGPDVNTLVEKNEDLTKLPGIGKDLAEKIIEIVKTGRSEALEKLRKESAPGLTELLKIPGLGPKRVRALYHELDIHNSEQLLRAAKDGRIKELPGFGPKTETQILESLVSHIQRDQRVKLAIAAQYVQPLVAYLKRSKAVDEIVVAGSYRRCKETVGDLDILVTASQGKDVMDRFANYDEVNEVVSKGSTRATVILRSGIQVDLRVVPQDSFGAALHYFTGSKAHNIAVRRLGQQQGLKINEYGVFKGDKLVAGKTEESVFKSVGLPWIPPEMREDRGEIELAKSGKLPKLVELADLKGDLHAHTKATDGNSTIEEMAMGAKERGLMYLAVTDHSKHLTVAHGLDARRLAKQGEEIDKLNEDLKGITLLKGIEVDILEDGQLDLPDSALEKLDMVVIAVHSKFNLSRQKQTERILRAMDSPYCTILAHPTGRLLQEREPYDVDMPHIIRQARQRGCFMEINSHPERMDLLDTYCQMAKDEGVLISINSDAHSIMNFDNLRYGVGQARRGWLEKEDVLNTRPLNELRKLLKRVRK